MAEVTEAEVKYRKADNPDGPLYTLKVADLMRINYENGQSDIFARDGQLPSTVLAGPTGDVKDTDPTGVTYTIDISTPEGKLKLDKISLAEAQQLALVECLMKYNCATLFNPQYTHLKKGKDILRVTVYGFPARYKRLETEKESEVETMEETRTDGDRQVSTQKTTTRQRTPAKPPRTNKRR